MLPLTRQISLRVATGCRPFKNHKWSPEGGDPQRQVGRWPRTKEERERAAKKYNLIPEDYEPYDEGEGYGDYPKLKAIGQYNRDKYDDYDDPVSMRFYGEVFHRDDDLYQWERYDPLDHEKPGPPLWQKCAVYLFLIVFTPGTFWLFKTFRININHPWKQRQPFPDQKYYQFPQSSSSGHH